jgi:hypothetical protein
MAKPEKQLTLFQSATAGGRVIKQGYLAQFILDGAGAMLTPIGEWNTAEKWANSKYASGNRMSDRNRFLDQIQVLVSRPGSFVGTRGSMKPLEDLCKLMKSAGHDLAEWQLPPELKDMGKPKPEEPKKPASQGQESPGAGPSGSKPAP